MNNTPILVAIYKSINWRENGKSLQGTRLHYSKYASTVRTGGRISECTYFTPKYSTITKLRTNGIKCSARPCTG